MTLSMARTRRGAIDLVEAKEIVVSAIANGATVAAAMEMAQRKPRSYENWRQKDPVFAKQIDEIRAAHAEGKVVASDPETSNVDRAADFVTFRKRFFNMDTYEHQLQWVDVLEGRPPRPIEGTDFRHRDPQRLVINVPPFHAKSQTLTVDYSCWLIANDPNVRIIIVSKRAEFAKKFLYQIRQRLTSTMFAKFQAAYAPEGGWRPAKGDGTWASSTLYVAGRTADHKDPTVEAVGITGQIYGARADLIIVDDAVVLSNANEFDKQVTWLESEVWSRLKNGRLLVVGTRLAPRDMYSELLDDTRYPYGESPWSYLRQPMVLEYAETPEQWRTLWPTTTTSSDSKDEPDEHGRYVMWDGPRAAQIRDSSPARVWNLVYQQQVVGDDSVFDDLCVAGSISGDRRAGPLTAGAHGHPARGSEGMYTIGAMDPAMAGVTFSVVGSLDPATSEIWVENAWQKKAPPATYFREHIKEVTERYGVDEWVIESSGFQGFLSEDPELKRWLAQRGVKMVEHITGKGKNDPDFGVAGVAPLFGHTTKVGDGRNEFVKGSNLLKLPRTSDSEGLRSLVDQLLVWEPGKKGSKFVQDGPMALWFLTTRARIKLGHRLGDERSARPAAQMQIPGAMRRHSVGSMSLPPALSGRRVYGGYR